MTDYDPFLWSIKDTEGKKDYIPHVMRAGLLRENRGFSDFSELWGTVEARVPEKFLRTIKTIHFSRIQDYGGRVFDNRKFEARVVGKHEGTQFTDEETGVKQSVIAMNVEPTHKISKEEFRAVFVHEIGHVVFRNLSEEELQRWKEVDKNVSVTAYVANRRSEGNIEHFVKDDFCESFALFTEIPGLLAVISPDRYNYMAELFKNHDEPFLAEKKRYEREKDV